MPICLKMWQTAWQRIWSLVARRKAVRDSETYAEVVARNLVEEKRARRLAGARVAIALRDGKYVWIDMLQNEAKDGKEKSATK